MKKNRPEGSAPAFWLLDDPKKGRGLLQLTYNTKTTGKNTSKTLNFPAFCRCFGPFYGRLRAIYGYLRAFTPV